MFPLSPVARHLTSGMSNDKTKCHYGKCHVCGERMEERQIKQDF